MKKKTVFDRHLYKEGTRSLMPFGFLILGLLLVYSLVYSASISMNVSHTNLSTLFSNLCDQYTILYFLIIVLIVPFFTLKTFAFLTTRNGSDFYHAIPHKKQCVYLSFAAAVFTWIAICTIVPATVSYVLLAALGANTMAFSLFSLTICHILAAALLVMSVICVACAITGTILTNILTTGIILFFPRLFIYACRLIVSSLTYGYFLRNSFFFGTRCNLVVQSIIGLEDNMYYLFSVPSLIYTLVLAILYLILAAFLFERRHSELAMKPALSRKLQAFFCLLLGTIASMIPITIIINDRGYLIRNGVDLADIFAMGILYLLIVIGMGVYELITTKKIRNLMRIIPRTGILAIINVVLVFGLYGGGKLILSYTPEVSDITSVSFAFSSENSREMFSDSSYNVIFDMENDYDSMYRRSATYFTLKSNAYTTSDETVKEIIIKSMKNTIAFPLGYSDPSDSPYSSPTKELLVNINTGHRTITRHIYVTTEDFTTIRETVLKDKDFTTIYTNLPDVDKKNLEMYTGSSSALSKDNLYDLYETIRAEVSSLADDNWMDALSYSGETEISNLTFAVTDHSVYVSGSIPITPLLPNSYQKYIDLVNSKSQGKLSTFSEQISALSKSGSSSTLSCNVIDPSKNYIFTDSVYIDPQLITEPDVITFLNTLAGLETKPVDILAKDSYIVNLSISTYDRNDSYDASFGTFVQIDKQTLDILIKPLHELDSSLG